MTDWQPIETAPRDGTRFLASQGDCVFSAFYKRNRHPSAVQRETLQVVVRPQQYMAAKGYFHPTYWMPLPEPPE